MPAPLAQGTLRLHGDGGFLPRGPFCASAREFVIRQKAREIEMKCGALRGNDGAHPANKH